MTTPNLPDLDAIQARADAATKGPWTTCGSGGANGVLFGTVYDPDDPTEPGILLGEAAAVVADFIADGPIFGAVSTRPSYVLGRQTLTIDFLTAKNIHIDHDTEVTIHA